MSETGALPSRTQAGLKVFLADDHRMFLEGICAVLNLEDGINVVGRSANAKLVVEEVRKLRPDVVVLDISMPEANGIDLCREVCRIEPKPAVLMLSVHSSEEYIAQAVVAGASGYLLKEAACDELGRAIRAVAAGHFYLGDGIPASALQRIARPSADPYESLSPRERDVLRLTAQGFALRDIGEALGIGPKTVDTHRRRLMKKLAIDNYMDLLKFAIRQGLVKV